MPASGTQAQLLGGQHVLLRCQTNPVGPSIPEKACCVVSPKRQPLSTLTNLGLLKSLSLDISHGKLRLGQETWGQGRVRRAHSSPIGMLRTCLQTPQLEPGLYAKLLQGVLVSHLLGLCSCRRWGSFTQTHNWFGAQQPSTVPRCSTQSDTFSSGTLGNWWRSHWAPLGWWCRANGKLGRTVGRPAQWGSAPGPQPMPALSLFCWAFIQCSKPHLKHFIYYLYLCLITLFSKSFFFNFIEGNTESRRVEWVIFLPLSCKVVRMECLRKFEAVAPLLSPVIHQRIYWMKTFKPKEHILNLHAVVYLFRKTTSHISIWLCGQEVLSKISLTWTRVCQYFCSFWPALCFCKDFWWGIHFSQLQWAIRHSLPQVSNYPSTSLSFLHFHNGIFLLLNKILESWGPCPFRFHQILSSPYQVKWHLTPYDRNFLVWLHYEEISFVNPLPFGILECTSFSVTT